METFFEPASVIASCCTTCSVLHFLRKSQSTHKAKEITNNLLTVFLVSLLISLLLPLFLAFVFTTSDTSSHSYWCWVKTSKSTNSLYFFYLPVFIAFLLNLSLMFFIYRFNKRINGSKFALIWWIPAFCVVWVLSFLSSFFSLLFSLLSSSFLFSFLFFHLSLLFSFLSFLSSFLQVCSSDTTSLGPFNSF